MVCGQLPITAEREDSTLLLKGRAENSNIFNERPKSHSINVILLYQRKVYEMKRLQQVVDLWPWVTSAVLFRTMKRFFFLFLCWHLPWGLIHFDFTPNILHFFTPVNMTCCLITGLYFTLLKYIFKYYFSLTTIIDYILIISTETKPTVQIVHHWPSLTFVDLCLVFVSVLIPPNLPHLPPAYPLTGPPFSVCSTAPCWTEIFCTATGL